MSSQGPLTFGTSADAGSGGGTVWGGSSPFSRTCSLGDSATSNYCNFTNCGFSIPTAATISGVQTSTTDAVDVSLSVNDFSRKLVKGGVISGTDQSIGTAWTNTPTAHTHGSISNLWGLTLTASDVNASNFGLAVEVINVSPASVATISAGTMTITYTAGGGVVGGGGRGIIKRMLTRQMLLALGLGWLNADRAFFDRTRGLWLFQQIRRPRKAVLLG